VKLITSIAGAAAIAAGIACAPAVHAAPSGHGNAGELVMQLQAQGNTVVVNRSGSHPLSQCTVASVRPGQTYTRYDSGYPGAKNDPMTQLVATTVYVDAQC
jgi:hypothetical protein